MDSSVRLGTLPTTYLRWTQFSLDQMYSHFLLYSYFQVVGEVESSQPEGSTVSDAAQGHNSCVEPVSEQQDEVVMETDPAGTEMGSAVGLDQASVEATSGLLRFLILYNGYWQRLCSSENV